MKDLNKLASECEQDLLSIGIQPGKVNRWIINTRAKMPLGTMQNGSARSIRYQYCGTSATG